MNNTDIKSIKTALKRLKPFTESKCRLPIMSYVRLDARDGKISFTVATMDYGLAFTTATVPSTSDKFTACVRFADMLKVIDKCKSDIGFTVTGCNMDLKSGSLAFKLNGKDPENFPLMPDKRDDLKASSAISYGDLKAESEFVSTATDDQTPNNYTSGVLFDYTSANRLRLIATDGRRLHSTFVKSRVHDIGDEKPALLVPVKWIHAFNRLKVASDETVYIKFYGVDRLDWNVPTEGLSGTVSLLDTPYPEYDKVIPDDCQSRFRLNVADTIETLNALSVVATQQDGRDMIVVNANGTLELSARSESMGDASGTVPCIHLDGPETRFALNVHYFTETLKLADRDAVVMANSGSLEPVRFDYPDTDRVAVVMPVRLPE